MNAKKPCEFESKIIAKTDGAQSMGIPRRRFLREATLAATALTCADFLRYFKAHGAPQDERANRLAREAVKANDDPHFLTYWYLEGGWCGYDMFNPVMTANHVHDRLDRISDERYRVLNWGGGGLHHLRAGKYSLWLPCY
ncbi:hypothetical protein N8612_04905 [Verrucomicrobia bacterium]|nr:hypothetical protein [Verrucomicrobiota bacterium]